MRGGPSTRGAAGGIGKRLAARRERLRDAQERKTPADVERRGDQDPLRLLAVGHLWGYHGYAVAFRHILSALERLGATVSASPVGRTPRGQKHEISEHEAVRRWAAADRTAPHVVLSFLSPLRLQRLCSPRTTRHVAIAEFESAALPDAAVHRLNQQDEVWNPSQWGAASFVSSGVKVPVRWMPHGVDLDVFRPADERPVDPDRLRVLTVATFQPRKGYDVLFRTAARALRITDTLVVVAYRARAKDVIDLAHRCRHEVGVDEGPAIEVVPPELSTAELSALYRSADVFALATRGEGDGLPVREAMASGLPTIATAAGPVVEVLGETTGYPVAAEPRSGLPAAYGNVPSYYRALPFFEPSEDAIVARLREIVAFPEEARRRGAAARRSMERGRSWDAVGATMYRRLEELRNQPA